MIIDLLRVRPKRRSLVKWFIEQHGGVWKYDGRCSWECDDGRRITRTSSCHCDDYCNHRPVYWLYEAGKIPRSVTT